MAMAMQKSKERRKSQRREKEEGQTSSNNNNLFAAELSRCQSVAFGYRVAAEVDRGTTLYESSSSRLFVIRPWRLFFSSQRVHKRVPFSSPVSKSSLVEHHRFDSDFFHLFTDNASVIVVFLNAMSLLLSLLLLTEVGNAVQCSAVQGPRLDCRSMTKLCRNCAVWTVLNVLEQRSTGPAVKPQSNAPEPIVGWRLLP